MGRDIELPRLSQAPGAVQASEPVDAVQEVALSCSRLKRCVGRRFFLSQAFDSDQDARIELDFALLDGLFSERGEASQRSVRVQ